MNTEAVIHAEFEMARKDRRVKHAKEEQTKYTLHTECLLCGKETTLAICDDCWIALPANDATQR